MNKHPFRLIVRITGATGTILGVRLLQVLREAEVETHLVLSNWGARTLVHENSSRGSGYAADQSEWMFVHNVWRPAVRSVTPAATVPRNFGISEFQLAANRKVRS